MVAEELSRCIECEQVAATLKNGICSLCSGPSNFAGVVAGYRVFAAQVPSPFQPCRKRNAI
jgi:hypothetical protein